MHDVERVGKRGFVGRFELHTSDGPGLGRGAVVDDFDIRELPHTQVLLERAAPLNPKPVEKRVDRGLLVAGMVAEVEVDL